jgi:hypothetical protein
MWPDCWNTFMLQNKQMFIVLSMAYAPKISPNLLT